MPVLLNDGQCQFGIFTSGRFMLCNQTQKSVYCAQSTKVEYIPPRYVKKLLSQQSTMCVYTTYLLTTLSYFSFSCTLSNRAKKNNVILSLFLPTQPFLLLKKICQKRLCSFYYIAMYVCGMHRAAMFPSSSTSYVKYFFFSLVKLQPA